MATGGSAMRKTGLITSDNLEKRPLPVFAFYHHNIWSHPVNVGRDQLITSYDFTMPFAGKLSFSGPCRASESEYEVIPLEVS
jgi:hypothetical protein